MMGGIISSIISSFPGKISSSSMVYMNTRNDIAVVTLRHTHAIASIVSS